MADWKDNKGAGSWDFTEQPDKWGYLNNPLWSAQQDAIDFCEKVGLPLGSSDQHKPCGHWHKVKVSEEPFPSGKWVAAMQQPGTPYIYVYDILYKAVIRIDTSEIPVFVSGRLELDSAYALDYNMGWGNPGAQRGAYCMNKDATRIWYLFCDQRKYIHSDHPNAQLIEVDISKTEMSIVEKTIFLGLIPFGSFPQYGAINDGCSDDTHTYWCTDLIAGRIIKIRNSDHSIIDDHYFNYPLVGGGGNFDEGIVTIDANKSTEKLYWVYCRDHFFGAPIYNACRHLIRADLDLVDDIEEIICGTGFGTPGWQNMIRVYSNYVLHHRGSHPFSSPFMKRTLDLSNEDTVAGTAFYQWACIKDHIALALNRPTSGVDYSTYWSRWNEQPGGNVWQEGKKYHSFAIMQEYLQNIFGVKNNYVFTLMHVNSLDHPARLYCINFSDMAELSNLDISYYTGQSGLFGPFYDWDWTSVSAMNYQTGVIAIFRYHNVEERNYAGCFNASPSLEFLCDVPLHIIRHDSGPMILSEPQIWPFEGFTPPEIPEEDPPIYIIVPPGGSPGPGEEPYVPPPPPPPDAPDNVPIIQSGYIDYMFVGPGQTIFFKMTGCTNLIQIGNTPGSDQPCTVHLLIGKNQKPTIADFERTWLMSPDLSGTGGFYWKYNIGSQAEFVEIAGPIESDIFYIMLYNSGIRSVRNQRLTLYY